MNKSVRRILKNDEVKFEGRVQLNMIQPQVTKGGLKGANSASTAQQVRILENHPEFAVIEVICGCGARTHVRCEYANAEVLDSTGDVQQAHQ